MLLAMDTSTNWASLALLDGDQVRAHVAWEIGRQQSVEILGKLASFLREAGITREQVTALAVATGPGSFNGTRVAVTVAKTLAFVWRIPLLGIATLDGLAQSQVATVPNLALDHPLILAASEAGRDELYYSWYDLTANVVARRGEIQIASVAALASEAPEQAVLVTGEINPTHQAQLQDLLGEHVHFAEPLAAPDRAVGIARLALARWRAGDLDDALRLEPYYVRRPNITTSTRHPLPPVPTTLTDK